jgi:ribulose kinase
MRSAKQAAAVAACGAPELRVNAGGAGPVSAEWMVPKALWLKQNEPGVYDAAHWVCEYQVRAAAWRAVQPWHSDCRAASLLCCSACAPAAGSPPPKWQ